MKKTWGPCTVEYDFERVGDAKNATLVDKRALETSKDSFPRENKVSRIRTPPRPRGCVAKLENLERV